MFKGKTLFNGFALFSMFFGAGNAVFPLIMGIKTGENIGFGLIGLLLTGVLLPFIGLYSMTLYRGDGAAYFDRIGRGPALVTQAFLLALLGPFGAIPRCMMVAHSALTLLFPNLSILTFSLISSLILFLLLIKQKRLLDILGMVLTPVLFLSLGYLVIKGLLAPGASAPNAYEPTHAFTLGIKEGYQTMDLLAAFFFSTLICVKMENEKSSPLAASAIGAILLGLVYIAFGALGAHHGAQLNGMSGESLFGALGTYLLGSSGALIVSLIIGLACLTTALALAHIASSFLKTHICRDKVSSNQSLIVILLISSCVSTMKFSGITTLLGPLLELCYPALITLAFLNILYKKRGFAPVKTPIFISFVCSSLFSLFV